jgi:hypothetical protein
MTDFFDPTYLARGTERQRRAYAALDQLRVLSLLDPYTPVVAGTIPLEIDIPSSDLDILCEVHDLDAFAALITTEFGREPEFTTHRATSDALPTVLANFQFRDERFEIFGQPRPVKDQTAYRHLIIEDRLLKLAGPDARAAIRSAKEAGAKTEPAFARYFCLEGDPYQALLDLERLDDTALLAFMTSKRA